MDEERREGAELWQLIETLIDQVKSGQADIATLLSRADESDARADASDARAHRADARADRAEILADLGSARVDKIEAAERVDREMIAELQADGELSREHAKEMEQALRSSRVIGAAIGMLMAGRSLHEDQAFAILAKASQDSNRKLRDVAQSLVDGTPGEGLSR
jgi:ANTAR domain